MLRNKLANLLLYVPFNQEYSAPEKVQEALTINEFYKDDGCYYDPEFDSEIQSLNSLTDEAISDLDYPISREQMISVLEKQRDEEISLVSWIKNNGTGVYCVAGDAGTGKSTFLHHLEYKFKEYSWEFLDLQKSVYDIKIMEFNVEFKQFSTLRNKLLSSIINQMIEFLFVRGKDNSEYDYANTKKRIEELLSYYNANCTKLHPNSKVRRLYDQISGVRSITKSSYCTRCAEIFKNYYAPLCNKAKGEESFKVVIEQYFIFLQCRDANKKHIIVFDNLERYIGTDEIFNDQIIHFLAQLRAIRDKYSREYDVRDKSPTKFAKHFQFIVAMRKTSVRMFTPQQNSDFIAHKIDISEWFSIDQIIDRKIKWYNKHAELIEDYNDPYLFHHLHYILSDQGRTGSVLRGLRLKLNLLFNNDKRLIMDFLISALCSSNNRNYLAKAEMNINNPKISDSLKKFAYRSIIWRIVFNKLRDGDWLQHILSFGDNTQITAELDYARKILTILSNYSLERPQSYMSFYELVGSLYPNIHNVRKWFWEDRCKTERSKIARALYAMNYYDRRENNWFQFVDIQCNSQSVNRKHISDIKTFEDYLFQPSVVREMKIQITTSGKAYLGYVVHTFEFVSCIYDELPPLLYVVPTQAEIETHDVEELECIKVATRVSEHSRNLIKNDIFDINNGYDIRYRKNQQAKALSYAERIRYAHQGYLSNFSEFFDMSIADECEELRKKKQIVLSRLKRVSDMYYQ